MTKKKEDIKTDITIDAPVVDEKEKDILDKELKTDESEKSQDTNVNENKVDSTDDVIKNEESLNNDSNEDLEDDKELKTDELVELEVLISFDDKYTDEKYVIGRVISVTKKRANELLNDSRHLVELK